MTAQADTPESVAARLDARADAYQLPNTPTPEADRAAAALIRAQASKIARLTGDLVTADASIAAFAEAERMQRERARTAEARATQAEAERDAAFKMRGFWEERYYAALSTQPATQPGAQDTAGEGGGQP